MKLWLILLAGGLLTYLIRLSFIFLFGKIEIPAWLRAGCASCLQPCCLP